MFAWLSITPLGRPVDPLVYRIAARSCGSWADGLRKNPASAARSSASPSPSIRSSPAISSGDSVANRGGEPINSRAPESPRICATCARLSKGLTGTWTNPARAAASGIRQVSSPLAAQVATRAPFSGITWLNQPLSAAIRALKSLYVRTPLRRTSAGASSAPASARWSSGRIVGLDGAGTFGILTFLPGMT